jgi:hypothetical protein
MSRCGMSMWRCGYRGRKKYAPYCETLARTAGSRGTSHRDRLLRHFVLPGLEYFKLQFRGPAVQERTLFSLRARAAGALRLTDIGRRLIQPSHACITVSTVFAGQAVGIKEIHDHIVWLVSFMDYDLGYFDLETRVLEPLENPFGPKVLPM